MKKVFITITKETEKAIFAKIDHKEIIFEGWFPKSTFNLNDRIYKNKQGVVAPNSSEATHSCALTSIINEGLFFQKYKEIVNALDVSTSFKDHYIDNPEQYM